MITIKYKGVEVTCTTADEAVEIIKKIDEAELARVTIPNVPFIPSFWPDCDKCLHKPDPNKPTVGDSPCTWCKRNQFYCSSIMTDSVRTTGSVNVTLESERCGDQCPDNNK